MMRIENIPKVPAFIIRIAKESWSYICNRRELKKMLEGQRVLILGSGPSLTRLTSIPENFKVLATNHSIAMLQKVAPSRIVDLYILFGNKTNSEIARLILNSHFNYIFSNASGYRSLGFDKRLFKKMFFFNPFSTRFLEGYFDLDSYKEFLRKSMFEYGWPSSGAFLLAIAIFFGAKEIWLAGIDNTEGHWNESSEVFTRNYHTEIDCFLYNSLAKIKHNIFSASEESPITRFFPYKRVPD